MNPPPTPPPSEPSWLQFRVSYLLYLTAIFAIAFAFIRPIVAVSSHWLLTVTASVYIGLLTIYFGIRFPIVLRRWRRQSQRLSDQRREMQELADHCRQNPK